jgi:hypothetical protein
MVSARIFLFRPNLTFVYMYIRNARILLLIFVICLAVNGGFDSARTQREGMGLLEYQATPSLRRS